VDLGEVDLDISVPQLFDELGKHLVVVKSSASRALASMMRALGGGDACATNSRTRFLKRLRVGVVELRIGTHDQSPGTGSFSGCLSKSE